MLERQETSGQGSNEAVPALETVTAAALEYRGRRFTGASHFLALQQLMDTMEKEHTDYSFDDIAQGFVTSTGRFVDRDEAMQLAKHAGQVDDDKSGGLESEWLQKQKLN